MSSQAQSLTNAFLEFSRWKLLEQYWPRLRESVNSLDDEQVWWRPNPASNSVGNLLLHLNGNVTQWMVASFNREQDARNRPAEFSAREGMPTAGLVERLDATMQRTAETLARLTEADLQATYQIQGFTVSGVQAVYQVVEHFALHYGQVVYIVKQLEARDLGFTNQLDTHGRAKTSGEKP